MKRHFTSVLRYFFYKFSIIAVLAIITAVAFVSCNVVSGGGSTYRPTAPSNPTPPEPPSSELFQKISPNATAIEWTRDKSVYGNKPVDVYMVRMNVAYEGHRTESDRGQILANKLHYLSELFLDGKPETPPALNIRASANVSAKANAVSEINFSLGGDGNLETLKQKFSGGAHPTEKQRQLTKADFDNAVDGDAVRRRMFTLNAKSRRTTDTDVYVYDKPFEAAAWGEHCIVWWPAADFKDHKTMYKISDLSTPSPNDYVPVSENTITRNIIDKQKCQTIVDKFELMYPYMTEMFGDKAKQILYPDGSTMDIEYFTDLANFTNIFVYDLSVSGTGFASGFFMPTDYAPKFKYITYNDVSGLNKAEAIYSEVQPDSASEYSVYMQSAITNMCNMLHVSATKVKDDFEDTLITVAHEYMHSLQFARKVIEGHQPLYGYKWSYAYGEMLGCMCEDVMGDVLGISPESTVIHTRLGAFMTGSYNECGVLDYQQAINGASYANVTAFGVFLTRNFGGPRLLGEMVKNKSDGWDAIIDAVRTVTGKQYTKEGLVRDFCESVLCKNSAFNTNKKSAALNVNGTQFVMNEVNFFDLRKYYPNEDPSETWLYGIDLLNSPYNNAGLSLRPDGGIHLCLLAKNITANEIRATFTNNSSSYDPAEIIYIMVDESRF